MIVGAKTFYMCFELKNNYELLSNYPAITIITPISYR